MYLYFLFFFIGNIWSDSVVLTIKMPFSAQVIPLAVPEIRFKIGRTFLVENGILMASH